MTVVEKAKKLLLDDFTIYDEIKWKSSDILSRFAGAFNDDATRHTVVLSLESYLSQLVQARRLLAFSVDDRWSSEKSFQISLKATPALQTVKISVTVI